MHFCRVCSCIVTGKWNVPKDRPTKAVKTREKFRIFTAFLTSKEVIPKQSAF